MFESKIYFSYRTIFFSENKKDVFECTLKEVKVNKFFYENGEIMGLVWYVVWVNGNQVETKLENLYASIEDVKINNPLTADIRIIKLENESMRWDEKDKDFVGWTCNGNTVFKIYLSDITDSFSVTFREIVCEKIPELCFRTTEELYKYVDLEVTDINGDKHVEVGLLGRLELSENQKKLVKDLEAVLSSLKEEKVVVAIDFDNSKLKFYNEGNLPEGFSIMEGWDESYAVVNQMKRKVTSIDANILQISCDFDLSICKK